MTGDVLLSGCADQCVTDVCAVDSFCCSTNWDSACVTKVYSVCGSKRCAASAGSCAHPLCTNGAALTAGCDVTYGDCVTQICNVDGYCCNNSWDSSCVNEVATVCSLTCE